MIEALDLEIIAARLRDKKKITLENGMRLGDNNGQWTRYQFFDLSSTDVRELEEESNITLAFEDQETVGKVISVSEEGLLLSIATDLGATLSQVTIFINRASLLEPLRERLQKVLDQEQFFRQSTAERVIGNGKIRSTALALPANHPLLSGLNPEQQEVVKRCLGSNVTYLWGPPGTGKTTTIARIVEGFYRAGRRVLLVSNTNVAVDTALEKICERLAGDPDFQEGKVIRLGTVVKEDLAQRFGKAIILDEIIARRSAVLEQNRNAALQIIATTKAEISPLEQTLKREQDRQRLPQLIDQAGEKLASIHQDIEAAIHRIRAVTTRVRDLEEQLRNAQAATRVTRLFKRLNPEAIASLLERERSGYSAVRLRQRELSRELERQEQSLQHLRRQEKEVREHLDAHPERHTYPQRIALLQKKVKEQQLLADEAEQALRGVEGAVLAESRLIAATAHHVFLSKQIDFDFDAVVIDEASMIILPMVYYACGHARQNAVVAGDFRQLPPIVASTGPKAQEWLNKDIFEKSGITAAVSTHQAPEWLCALKTQFRMQRAICECVNDFFYYDHRLETAPAAEARESTMPLAQAPLLYLDTASMKPWAAKQRNSTSRYNLLHALLIRNIVVRFAASGYLALAEGGSPVGVVIPYTAQAKLIKALIREELELPVDPDFVSTVHRFQGNEKETIIIDATDADGVRLGTFFQAKHREEIGGRLLNVAFSRARSHIILIADFSYLRKHARKDLLIRRLLDYFVTLGTPLQLEDLLPAVEDRQRDALGLIDPESSLPHTALRIQFDEDQFYPAFQEDLRQASSSIVIFSPFVTYPGLYRWRQPLSDALLRGVKVRLFIRPLEELDPQMTNDVLPILESLARAGVIIETRSAMHEKLAMIDGIIFWHGSLNIFSHHDTHESMLRLSGKQACRAIEQLMACKGKGTVAESNGSMPNRSQSIPGNGAPESFPCPQPGCGGTMVRRKGPYSVFYACSRFPKCRHRESGNGTLLDFREKEVTDTPEAVKRLGATGK